MVTCVSIPSNWQGTCISRPARLVNTSTCVPSGFVNATWLRLGMSPVDDSTRAPRSITLEKCAKAQYWPQRVIFCVPEWMVTMPPDWPGPLFGLPFSSSARFQPTMDLDQFRSTPVKVSDHSLQSVSKSGLVITAPYSVAYMFWLGNELCTRLMESTVPS